MSDNIRKGPSGPDAGFLESGINIREEGADPTGVNDARPAIVACIERALGIPAGYLDDPTKGDAGYVNAIRPSKYVYVPDGHFRMSAGITIRYMGVSIVGVPSSVQGGMQGNGSLIECDFDGDAFLLYTGAAGEFAGARDLSVKSCTIKRAAGHTGNAGAVDGGTWTSGFAFDGCRLTGHSCAFEVKATYNNPAFARLMMAGTIIDNCDSVINTNQKHLSNSYIPWARFTQCSSGFDGGLTGSILGQVNCEGITTRPVRVRGTNSYAFEIGPLYFEDHNSGPACLDINLARDFIVKGIQTSGTVSIPLVRLETVSMGSLVGHNVVCVGATDCDFSSMLIPATGYADNEFAAAWVMGHGMTSLPLMPRLPWTCQGVTGAMYTEAADFGSETLKAVRVGTSGVPSSRVTALTFTPTAGTLVDGDVALLAWAVRYDAGRGGLSSAANIQVQGRKTSDGLYEDIGVLNIDHLNDVAVGDIIQFITAWRIVADATHTPPYNAFRIYFYPYGTDTTYEYYDAMVSPFLYTEIDGSSDILVPPFDVPCLLKATIGDTRLDPPQLTASVNNYAPGLKSGVNTLYLSADAPWDVTGFLAVIGMSCRVVNNGAQPITLKNNDAGSAAGNKTLTSTGADIVLAANGVANLYYDATAEVNRAS